MKNKKLVIITVIFIVIMVILVSFLILCIFSLNKNNNIDLNILDSKINEASTFNDARMKKITTSNINEIFDIDENYINIKSYLIRDEDHYLVEVVSIKASKSFMIEKIVTKEKIEKNNIYTIGDGINDIDMIRDYNGYRVKKSCSKLYSITSKVVFSVNDLISRVSK